MPRILVTGSRDWDNRVTISRVVLGYINKVCPMLLDENGHPDRRDTSDVVIVHGACPDGADALVEEWAQGCVPPIKTEPHPADWVAAPKIGGLLRNKYMVDLGADICLAFLKPCVSDRCQREEVHYSHGAAHCLTLAHRAGIEVQITD